jgi:hypothetical protein
VTPELFAEGVDVLFVTCRALLAWIVVAAVCATGVGVGVVAAGVGAWRAVRSRSAPASRPQTPPRGSHVVRATERPSERRTGRRVPAWATSQPPTDHNIEEAA